MAAILTPEQHDLAMRSFARAVEIAGSQGRLGKWIGLNQPAVSKRLRKRVPLPAEHVLTVERETGVSRHDLRPDLYPRELPPASGATPEGVAA